MNLKRTRRLLGFVVVFAVSFFMLGCGDETTLNNITTNAQTSSVTAAVGTAKLTVTSDIEVVVGTTLPDFTNYVVLENADAADLTIDFSNVNINNIGEYKVYYTLFKGTANEIEAEATVTVSIDPNDKRPSILGVEDITYVLGEAYPDFLSGVTAQDSKYGDLTPFINVEVTGLFTNQVGTYDILYSVENHDGYVRTAKAQLTVTYNDTAPVLPTEFIIVQDEYYGVRSLTGEQIIPNEYDNIKYMGDHMLYMVKDDLSYYYDIDSKTYHQYDYIFWGYFSGGYAAVYNDFEYMSFMNKEGEIILPFRFNEVQPFYEGLAIVRIGNNYGVIDESGNEVVTIQYDSIIGIADGYYLLSLDDEYTIIDSDGIDVLTLSSNWFSTYELEDGTILYKVEEDGYQVLTTDEFVTLLPAHYTNILQLENDYFFCTSIFGGVNLWNANTHKNLFNTLDYISVGDLFIIENEEGYGIYDTNTETYLLEPTYESIVPYFINNDLFVATRTDGLKAIIDQTGTVISGFVISNMSFIDIEDYVIYEDAEGNLGTLSADGNIIEPASYSEILFSGKDHRIVEDAETGLLGFIDKTGTEFIAPTFYNARTFNEGFALVKTLDNDFGWTYVALDGTYISNTMYQASESFENGFAKVRVNDQGSEKRWKLINTDGTELTLDAYAYIDDMKNGYVVVKKDNASSYGMIDEMGTVIVPCSYDYVSNESDGMVLVQDSEGKYGYYNTNQELVITPKFFMAYDFHDGVAIVENEAGELKLISKTGSIIKDYSTLEIKDYAANVAVYRESGGTKYGLLDKLGNVVLEPTYSYIGLFVNGLAPVQLTSGEYGYINNFGEIVIEAKYDTAGNFNENGPYAIVVQDDKYGLINASGEPVFEIAFDNIYMIESGYHVRITNGFREDVLLEDNKLSYNIEGKNEKEYTMVYDDGWKLFDGETLLVDRGYMLIEYFEAADLWMVQKNRLWGLMDQNFEEVVMPQYDAISINKGSSKIRVEVNDNFGVLSITGEEIVPAIYDSVYYQEDLDIYVVVLSSIVGMYSEENGLFIPVQYYDLYYINLDEYNIIPK